MQISQCFRRNYFSFAASHIHVIFAQIKKAFSRLPTANLINRNVNFCVHIFHFKAKHEASLRSLPCFHVDSTQQTRNVLCSKIVEIRDGNQQV